MEMRLFFVVIILFFGIQTGKSQDSLKVGESFTMEYLQEPLANGWWEVISYDGKFRLTVPGKMELKSDTITTDIGRLNYHVFYHEHFSEQGSGDEKNPEKNLLFLLSIYEYPPHSIHSDSSGVLQNYFEATIDGAVQGVNGDLIYSDDIKLNEYPGKVWRINYNGNKDIIRTHAYLVERRLYLLSVVSNKAFSINAANDRFFNSFRVFD